MRAPGLLVLMLVVGVVLSGCKSKDGDAATAPDPAAIKAQQELKARRDALLAARKQLQDQRDKVVDEIKVKQQAGDDTKDLDKKKADLDSQLETQTSDLINTLSTKLDAIQATGDKTAQVASREAEIGSRERTVADREARVAEREKQLAQRDYESAQRWKDSCASAGPPVIIQAPVAKGANYTRKDVEPLLSKARAGMAKKGMLGSDLPGTAQGLEGEATKAMGEGDWGRAYLAAAQLSATVDAVKVDRAFITAKYARLQSRVSSTKQDEATSGQLTEGMKDVLQKYGDGDFGAANRKLNQLWGLVH